MNDQAVKVAARDGRYIKIHDAAGFDGMRKAGRLAAECLDFITPHVNAGVTTDALNTLCHDWTLERGAIPATVELSRLSKVDLHINQSRRLPRHSKR